MSIRIRLVAVVSVSVLLLLASESSAQKPVKPGPADKDAAKDYTTTKSGLKYRVLRKSDKQKPKADEAVEVHYRGWLPDDGKVFDSSYQRGESIRFPLGGVIKGWTEGLQLIGVGGMIELEIPSELAYGKEGSGDVIPRDATLRFLVELLSIVQPGPRDKDAPQEFTTTPSGLKYRVLRKSDQKKPKVSSTVKVHYRGWLPDKKNPDTGKGFDSSYKRGEPIAFPLRGVIPGWTEGLQLVGEGGMIELEIPSNLAYGEAGAGEAIPPNATLRFIVELIEVDPKQTRR